MEAFKKGDFRIMSKSEERIYTIADIEALPEGERAELIDGKIYYMASPFLNHQDILMWLSIRIWNHIDAHKGKCRIVPAPFGVFIKNDDRNYLEPDISVICDRDKLDQKGCHGAPDWVIEIVSPSSRRMDYRSKLSVYREAGVGEYWIADYDRGTVSVYLLQQPDAPAPVVYGFADTVQSHTIKDLKIDFSLLSEYLL